MADKSLKQLMSFVLLPEMVLERQLSFEPTGIGFKVYKDSNYEMRELRDTTEKQNSSRGGLTDFGTSKTTS